MTDIMDMDFPSDSNLDGVLSGPNAYECLHFPTDFEHHLNQ